jgi:hypothetical protein
VPGPRKRKTRKPKNGRRVEARINRKFSKMMSANPSCDKLRRSDNNHLVKVGVRLLPETRLLLALANEEIEARRRDG